MAAPPPSEPGPEDINETENKNENKANSNEIISSEAEPSETVQVADEAEDPARGGKVDHPSLGGWFCSAPSGDPLSQEAQRLPYSQYGGQGDERASKKRAPWITGQKLSLRPRSRLDEADQDERRPSGPIAV